MMERTAWDTERVLGQLRDWLERTAVELDSLPESNKTFAGDRPSIPPSVSPPQQVGLLQVVEALTSMRHELKLQTKSSRGLEEAVQQACAGLERAMERFESAEARQAESGERAMLPLIESLVGLDESLGRAGDAFDEARRQLPEMVASKIHQALLAEIDRMPSWRRWFMSGTRDRLVQQATQQAEAAAQAHLAALAEGYRLVRDRLSQELRRQGIVRLETIGRLVDPSQMRVVALANSEEGPAETVVEEIRPGYRWGERLLRPAEVRAVASHP